MTADNDESEKLVPAQLPAVGYKKPPVQNRFKPGQSGNPAGRAKGSKNLKTLLDQILKEEVSLREGSEVRRVSKGEAIVRSVVLGALKGDVRQQATLFRLAEQTGQFDEPGDQVTEIRRIIVGWSDQAACDASIVINTGVPRTEDANVPAITDISKEPK